MAENQKKAFLFYASNWKVLEQFPLSDRVILARKIVEYGITGQCSDMTPRVQVVLRPIFESIDVQKRRYENIETVNGWIYKFKSLLISVKDENDKKVVNNTLNELKKLVMDCKWHDEKNIVDKLNPILNDVLLRNLYQKYKRTEQEKNQLKPNRQRESLTVNRYGSPVR